VKTLGEKPKKEKKAANEISGLLEALGLDGEKEVELEDVELSANELILLPSGIASATLKALAPHIPIAPPKAKPTTILEAPFIAFTQEYPGQIREVTLGANKSEGGSRGKTQVIGGATTPAFYLFEKSTPHPPVIAVDTFDMKVPLPKAIKMHVEEVCHGASAEHRPAY
jgi:acetyl-CoA decarbonylase/synthase complex subunit delta